MRARGIPVIRYLQKYAVAMGGARSHMYSLHNAILIKDNHIKMAGGITPAVERLRRNIQHTPQDRSGSARHWTR